MGPRYALGTAVVLAACSAVGCSSDARAPVSGKVHVGDKLVTAGEVRFHGPDNRFATTQIREDGSYSLVDAPVGSCKVTVHPPTAMMGKVGAAPKGVEAPKPESDGPAIGKAPEAKPSAAPPGGPKTGPKGMPGGLMLPDAKGTASSTGVIKGTDVPEKYQTPESTSLGFTVEKGTSNTFDIKLTK